MAAITNTLAAQDQTPAQVSPTQAVKQQLDRYGATIDKLLDGTGVKKETFVAQVANALRAQPGLLRCAPETILGAALRCAQLGLAPNDPRNQAWIIPFGGQAQFVLGYGGVMELARRAVPGLLFDGRPVYPNDEFDVDYGKERPLIHRPAVVRGMERGGPARAWYVRVTYPDGWTQVFVLDREGVEYHRSFSKQPNGDMWTKSYDAAALKSVVNDAKRWLPSSTQMVAALVSDEQVYDVRKPETVEVTYDRLPDDEPAAEEGESGGEHDVEVES